jgi:LmbE family N-acetylglucosaminyl deacetylase
MNIVVISPHPDDETLGAAGTLFRYKAQGHKIFWINITDPEENQGVALDALAHRAQQIREIEELFSFDKSYNLKLPPTKLDQMDRGFIIERIGTCIKEIKPEWLILPDGNDAHSDHKVVFECCMACSKIFRYPYIKKITTMEILSETDFGKPYCPFVPNYFVDISDYLEQKLQALQIYDTEIGEPPFPRNIEAVKALATIRGGTSGVRYAEAFKIIKWIE